MTSTRCWAPLILLASLPLPPPLLLAQSSAPVTLEATAPVRVKAGEAAPLVLHFRLAPGYHTNSNTPADEYLIPLRLTWEAAPLEVAGIDYPKGKQEKYEFSEKPLSVYSGEFDVTTRFKAPAGAPKGERKLSGKLRYQACTSTACFPPRNLAVQATVAVQ